MSKHFALEDYFLPYQHRWLKDHSRVKIWEKSRRIGATYVQSFEDVCDAADGKVPAIWFSSADESAAREYILYCEQWARMLNVIAKPLGEQVVDEKRAIKAYQIEFKRKDTITRISALSSNPKAFRSKGGKIVLDEFGWHDDPKALWAAARPCITWGFPLRILSTHNGLNSLYNQFITKVKAGKLKWALHTTDIYTAVNEGLADRIRGRTLTEAERNEWIEEERQSVSDETVWQQEYCCQPQDENSALLTYDLIFGAQHADILRPLSECSGPLYLGYDIARKKDLSVIWVIEKVAGFDITRAIIVMEKTPFREQQKRLYDLLELPNMTRACIDKTGIGAMLAEGAVADFGEFKVEELGFTAPLKESLATRFYTGIQDRTFLIPDDYKIRDDFHSVRKVTTAAGNVRFDVAANEGDGHADRFWAAAMAKHAADDANAGPVWADSGLHYPGHDIANEYSDFSSKDLFMY